MRTWICAPMNNIYSPLLGTARLYSYIKKQGHDVSFKDLNQDAYFTLLSREYLEPSLERMMYSIDSVSRNIFLREDLGAILLNSSNNAIRQLVTRGMLVNTTWYKYIPKINSFRKPVLSIVGSKVRADNVLYALLSEKEFVFSEIEQSRKILDKGFFSLSPDEFVSNFHTLLAGKALIDAAYFPAQIDFGLGFYGTAFSPRTSDIVRAVEDERYNFLIPYYANEVLPMLERERPGVVGISITCMSEFIPAFTLAHMIKRVDPEVHITLGGVLVTEEAERFAKNTPLWNMIDSLVLGPGEHVFSELIEKIDKKAELSDVPNIIYKDKGAIKKSDKSHGFNINEACTPEFVSARPKSFLPLETASSCYWGKCIFCYYPKQGMASPDSKHNNRPVRNIELVISDMKELKARYDPSIIFLTDSAVHPKRLEAIAEENIRDGTKLKFSSMFRFEKEFKSKAFCSKLAEGGLMGGHIGLESGSPRVNDIINKGINLDDTGLIIKNLNEVGILLGVSSIVGTPGETEEDAIMTYDFFKRWHRWLKLNWEIYPLYVLEHSPLAQRASEFGIEVTPLPDDFLVESMDYRLKQGLSPEESMRLSISYAEKLRRFMHPLNEIMDIQSLKVFLISQMANGFPPEKVRKIDCRV